jgi:hypothetical protein
MGGSLGVALFGAIFASRLMHELTTLPGGLATRFSGGVNVSPAQVHSLPPGLRDAFVQAFVDALQPVFLVGAGVTALAFVLSLLLREVPLRATAHADAGLAANEAIAGGSGAEAVVPTAEELAPARR